MDRLKIAPLVRVDQTGRRTDQDLVPVEAPLNLEAIVTRDGVAETVRLGVFLRTPGDDVALATGLLFAEGLIHRAADIAGSEIIADPDGVSATLRLTFAPGVDVDRDALARSGVATTSCGLCGRLSDQLGHKLPVEKKETGTHFQKMSPGLIFGLPEQLRAAQALFAETGALHAAGLFDLDGTLVDLAEDVGRHNAVDKLIGRALIGGRNSLENQILVVSGRVAFEIVQKAAMAGIGTLVAIGAPTSLAVQAARETGIQLIGFARSDRYNIY